MEPHEEVAAHLGPEFDEARDACRAAMRKNPTLSYLAHYSSGVFDFSVDVLGEPPRPEEALPGTTRRDEVQRLGRQLSFVVNGLDRTLQEARTGGLIRTVLHTENGAVFCDAVVPKENVIGVVVDSSTRDRPATPLAGAPDVRAADMAVAELATELRARVRLPSANPGGWESAETVAALASVGPSGDPRLTVHKGANGHTQRLVEACVRAVRPDDLHLVAYCSGDDVAFMVDHLDDRSLAPFFTQITVDTRRRFYLGFARELGNLAARLNRTLSSAVGGLLVRMVLDVEQGAIYYYRVGGDYLVGITIDQARVSTADDRMAQLALDAAEVWTERL